MLKTVLDIIISFGKIGLISLGGGGSMLTLLQYEAVNYRHWLTNEEFINMLGSSFLFPGLTAVKLSALIGYKIAGVFGLCLAILCLNVPGLVMAVVGYRWFATNNGPITRKLMISIQYGALALLAAACFSIAQGVVHTYWSISIAILSVLFFIALAFFNLSPFYGLLGFIVVCFVVGVH